MSPARPARALGHGAHVLLTGAAGAIGSAIGRALLRRDPAARISLVDVDRPGLEREARALGPQARGFEWDLASPDGLPERVRALEAERGPVDTLVNCAGIMDVGSITTTEWGAAARLLRIDLESPLRLMALVVPGMVARGGGTIVNVSSMAGVAPLRGCVYYGAAKAGLAMASEIAHLELAPRGVHVVTVYPGPVRSELERRARDRLPPTLAKRLLPTGDAEPLGERVADACRRRAARVLYPGVYGLFFRLPRLTAAITARLSPAPREGPPTPHPSFGGSAVLSADGAA